MRLKFWGFIGLCCVLGMANAQSIGDWRLHFTYENSIDIATSDNTVFSATDKALLLYEKSDGSIQLLDKANALSDIGISNIDYALESEALIIAYNSSNLDIFRDNTITNIPDIKNKLTAGSKNINEIFVFGDFAYLSTDFGIVVLDILNEEIDNTYVIGNTGDPTPVRDCTIFNDTIYAVTDQGLKSAPVNSPNLLDYTSWNHNIADLPAGPVTFSTVFNDQLYVVIDEILFQYNESSWDSVFAINGHRFQSLQASDILGFVLYAYNGASIIGTEAFELTIDGMVDTVNLTQKLRPRSIIKDNTQYFVADFSFGLMTHSTTTQRIFPRGLPFSNLSFSASSSGNKVFIAAGGISRNVDPLGVYDGFYYIENNNWQNVNQYTTTGFPSNLQDVIDVVLNPVDGKVYGGTAKGLLEYDFNQVTLYDRTNSPIDSVIGNGAFEIITGVDFDSDGNVWMTNSLTSHPLLVKTRSGEWFEYAIPSAKYNNIFVDSYDQKWIMLRNSGLLVFKETEIENTLNYNQVTISGGNLPNNTVNTIVEDKNGEIWIGTDEGVAVFDCPADVLDFSSGCQTARRIKATLDSVFTATEFLFETDVVRAIAVDGANRKWVGTESGLWLLNETGEEEILKFNTDNSPLPSNKVTDIAINEATGEVFITTELGMASYFSDATEPSPNHDNVKAYPNPVRPEYNGFISITGLVEDAFVKITDNAGILIDEGFALGGKYVWDGHDYNGKKAKTGVYFVFSSNPDGSEKVVTKIAFVN